MVKCDLKSRWEYGPLCILDVLCRHQDYAEYLTGSFSLEYLQSSFWVLNGYSTPTPQLLQIVSIQWLRNSPAKSCNFLGDGPFVTTMNVIEFPLWLLWSLLRTWNHDLVDLLHVTLRRWINLSYSILSYPIISYVFALVTSLLIADLADSYLFQSN